MKTRSFSTQFWPACGPSSGKKSRRLPLALDRTLSSSTVVMGSPRTLQHQLRHGELDRWLQQSHGLKHATGSHPVANKAIGSTKETESSFHLRENAARARSESPRTANHKERPGRGCRGDSWKVCRRKQT